MNVAGRQFEAEHYLTRGEVPPWVVEACDLHLGDLRRHHEDGHGEIHMRPPWARTGVKHGTTEEDGTDTRKARTA